MTQAAPAALTARRADREPRRRRSSPSRQPASDPRRGRRPRCRGQDHARGRARRRLGAGRAGDHQGVDRRLPPPARGSLSPGGRLGARLLRGFVRPRRSAARAPRAARAGGDRRYRTARLRLPYGLDRRGTASGSAAADAVLVLDGVFLQRPELCDGWEVAIFVAVEPEECLRRALERDARALRLTGRDRASLPDALPARPAALPRGRAAARRTPTHRDERRPGAARAQRQSSAAGELSGR